MTNFFATCQKMLWCITSSCSSIWIPGSGCMISISPLRSRCAGDARLFSISAWRRLLTSVKPPSALSPSLILYSHFQMTSEQIMKIIVLILNLRNRHLNQDHGRSYLVGCYFLTFSKGFQSRPDLKLTALLSALSLSWSFGLSWWCHKFHPYWK